ncbi:MAG: hypothetical protein M1454_04945 [Candidatus Thermoplasmatota archaeon]|nr:hypothetical protein [Candidatus Thermoplasmatota archaeon]MCL5731751.1 hypothetical protein [Candidatus Thermoplasmatota archaeon]
MLISDKTLAYLDMRASIEVESTDRFLGFAERIGAILRGVPIIYGRKITFVTYLCNPENINKRDWGLLTAEWNGKKFGNSLSFVLSYNTKTFQNAFSKLLYVPSLVIDQIYFVSGRMLIDVAFSSACKESVSRGLLEFIESIDFSKITGFGKDNSDSFISGANYSRYDEMDYIEYSVKHDMRKFFGELADRDWLGRIKIYELDGPHRVLFKFFDSPPEGMDIVPVSPENGLYEGNVKAKPLDIISDMIRKMEFVPIVRMLRMHRNIYSGFFVAPKLHMDRSLAVYRAFSDVFEGGGNIDINYIRKI